MAIGFFVTDMGDTDLAWETILKLLDNNPAQEVILYPISSNAEKRIRDKHLQLSQQVSQLKINTVITEADIGALASNSDIKQAYIGVPSAAQDLPYKIALKLNIPCIFAYEFMFKPQNHTLFTYLPLLQGKKNISFAVSLESAASEIRSYGFEANAIGHLSVDRASIPISVDKSAIKTKMNINSTEELVFISATTQPKEIDMDFLGALLTEILSGKYPNLQLRYGIHPGIKDMPAYFSSLSSLLSSYPAAEKQFKIILPAAIKEKLQDTSLIPKAFILECEVNGPDAGNAADRVAQAVLGALPTEAALRGKPAYAHQGNTYLPKGLLATSLSDLLTRNASTPPTKGELALPSDSAPAVLAKKIQSH